MGHKYQIQKTTSRVIDRGGHTLYYKNYLYSMISLVFVTHRTISSISLSSLSISRSLLSADSCTQSRCQSLYVDDHAAVTHYDTIYSAAFISRSLNHRFVLSSFRVISQTITPHPILRPITNTYLGITTRHITPCLISIMLLILTWTLKSVP